MPSFSFAPVIKTNKVRSHADSTSKYNTIIPNVEGIIFINIKGEYRVTIGNDNYDIASECYSCKGVSEVYSQELVNGKVRTRYIRNDRDRADMDRSMYLPFTAGCCVKGSIVRHKAANKVIFKIRKVYLDVDEPIARDAIKFYRANYKKIMDNINSQKVTTQLVESDIL